jgi:hypothetical protein
MAGMIAKAMLAAALLAAATGAAAQEGPDGYSCSARAFSNIGAIHGVGEGSVTVSAGPDYGETGASFTYAVRDRVSGFGRFGATWQLPGGRFEAATLQSIWLPFHRELAQMPAAIAIRLDGGEPATTAIADPARIQVGTQGRANGLTLLARDGMAPELRGRVSFGYEVKAADGTILFQDMVLMPDWRGAPGRIRAALREARGRLRRRDCNPFFRIGRQPTAADPRP